MSIKRRLLMAASLILNFFIMSSQAQLPLEPDFAFPKKVIKEAEKVYASSEGLPRMQAAMQIATAKCAVDPDSAAAMPAFIANTARAESSPAVRGLLTLYRARLMADYYRKSSYRFDRVDAPLEPLPQDLSEWSGEQFRTQIDSLTAAALGDLSPYDHEPLTDYQTVVSAPGDGKRVYTTLGDFAVLAAYGIYRNAGLSERADSLARATADAQPDGSLLRGVWEVKYDNSDDRLCKLYEADPKGEAAGYYLYNITPSGDERLLWLVNAIKKYVAAEPASNTLVEPLRDLLTRYTVPAVYVRAQSVAAPDKDFPVSVTHKFAKSCGVKVYRVTGTDASGLRSKRLIGEVSLNTDHNGIGTDSLLVSLPSEGKFAIHPVLDGVESTDKWDYVYIQCTPFLPFYFSVDDQKVGLLTDYTTGEPVPDATWSLLKKDNALLKIGLTGADGFASLNFRLKEKWKSYPLEITAGGKKYSFGDYMSIYVGGEDYESEAFYSGHFYLDRPIYRPGEEVRWSMTAVRLDPKKESSALAKNLKVRVLLRDANYQEVDTVDAVTDEYGRCTGIFSIPEGRLTGDYSIQASVKDQSFCNAGIMVSDFKAPVFEIKDLVAERDADGGVTVRGKAVTYAGMPVEGADVRVDVSELPRWRWFWWLPEQNDDGEIQVTGRTADNGAFEVKVPAADLDADQDYIAKVTVTSQAAEVAVDKACFTTGKPYDLMMGDLSQFCTDAPVKLPLTAYGPDGKPASLSVKWTLKEGDKSFDGQTDVTPDGLVLDLREVPAGKYALTVAPVDSAACDALKGLSLNLYSIERNTVPAGCVLIIPVKQFELKSGESVSVRVGSDREGYLYVLSNDGKKIVKTEAIKLAPGFNDITLTLPKGTERMEATMLAVRDGKTSEARVILKQKDEASLTLTAESMRDRLVPGSRETWKFTLRRADGHPVSGAMIATMYNHALDALYQYSWPSGLPRLDLWTSLTKRSIRDWDGSANFTLDKNSSIKNFVIDTPEFRYVPITLYIRGTRKYSLMSAARSTSAGLESDDMAEGVLYDMATPAPLAGNANMKEAEVAEEAAPEPAEDEGSPRQNAPKFREAEVLQALWLPDLLVNNDGSVTVTVDVPDAIGTWAFSSLAWDQTLHTASLTKEMTASKPVMVQAALPRFVRRGDTLKIISTVYNNTDTIQTCSTVVEFFDPISGAVLTTSESTDNVAANGSARVGTTIAVPTDATLLGYRVRVSAGNFSDGEQAAVPVLESGCTVIDTDNFVLTPERPDFSTKLPSGDVRAMTFQYVQNPFWDVVRAVPDLIAGGKAYSSVQAAQQVYGALTAAGMTRRFPALREVVEKWAANPADSALVSDLLKNEDIKQALLTQTPWVMAASSETERMARLVSVFAPSESKKALDKALGQLERFHNPDGGFRWGSWEDKSSLWASEEVAWAIGHAVAQGDVRPGDRAYRLAVDALGYCDRHIEKDDIRYAYILAFFPDYEPTTLTARKAVADAVNLIIKDWKKSATAEKARQAYILRANHQESTARLMMQSVAEYAVTDRDGAVSFPSVDNVYEYSYILRAFAAIDPQSPLIDGMRQWLMMRTRVSDDLSTRYPAPVIAALLGSGTDWTRIHSAATATVTVGDRTLDTEGVYGTGEITERLPLADCGRKLSVRRADVGRVSYGSVTSVAKKPMTEVKPATCSDLSVQKRYLVERHGAWVETTHVALGERVRVQLLIKANTTLDYITVNDERAAALEPVDQLPGYVYASSLAFYRENSDSRTRLFISRLPKGTYYLTYDMTAANEGDFASGIATVQSQYAPEVTAHSGGTRLTVTPAEQ